MSENFNSHIACEGTDNDINWVCKVCKDLPNYAGMYLYQREREKNQLKNVKDRRADLILLKYYYALYLQCLMHRRNAMQEVPELKGLSETCNRIYKLQDVDVLFQCLLMDQMDWEEGKLYVQFSTVYLLLSLRNK